MFGSGRCLGACGPANSQGVTLPLRDELAESALAILLQLDDVLSLGNATGMSAL
jgi:hypothetical protein